MPKIEGFVRFYLRTIVPIRIFETHWRFININSSSCWKSL